MYGTCASNSAWGISAKSVDKVSPASLISASYTEWGFWDKFFLEKKFQKLM